MTIGDNRDLANAALPAVQQPAPDMQAGRGVAWHTPPGGVKAGKP